MGWGLDGPIIEAGGAGLSWVSLDLTAAISLTDPNDLVGTATYNSGTDVNSIPYQNDSGSTLDGITEGAFYSFNLADTLAGMDMAAGDYLMIRVTGISGTVDWDDIGILIGLHDTNKTQMFTLGLGGASDSIYRAMRSSHSDDMSGASVTTDLSGGDLVVVGQMGWAPGSVTSHPGLAVCQMNGEASEIVGNMLSGTATVSNLDLIVGMIAVNTTDNGAKVAQVRLEVARVSFPTVA